MHKPLYPTFGKLSIVSQRKLTFGSFTKTKVRSNSVVPVLESILQDQNVAHTVVLDQDQGSRKKNTILGLVMGILKISQ